MRFIVKSTEIIPTEISIDRLDEFVQPGSSIGVKIRPESEWINDIVEDILYDSTIAIQLLDEFISQDIMVDDVIECRVIKDEVIYIIEGTVHDVGIIYPQRIMLQIHKITKYGNARDSKRYTVNLCGRVIYGQQDKSTFATIKNISRTGLSVTSKEEMAIGEEIDVDIVIWQQEVLSIEGTIVRIYKVGKNFKYGILIENMDKKSKELLEGFIEELEGLEKKEKVKKVK